MYRVSFQPGVCIQMGLQARRLRDGLGFEVDVGEGGMVYGIGSIWYLDGVHGVLERKKLADEGIEEDGDSLRMIELVVLRDGILVAGRMPARQFQTAGRIVIELIMIVK